MKKKVASDEWREKDNAETQRARRFVEVAIVEMGKRARFTVGLAALGLALTALIVVYQLLTNSYPPQPMSAALFFVFVILCPPSLLSIPIIDAETGTAAFYVLWTLIGLANAALYGAIGAVVGYVRYLWKSNKPTPN